MLQAIAMEAVGERKVNLRKFSALFAFSNSADNEVPLTTESLTRPLNFEMHEFFILFSIYVLVIKKIVALVLLLKEFQYN